MDATTVVIVLLLVAGVYYVNWNALKYRANPALVCPHCQTRGQVSTRRMTRKKGVSGAKATAAILTGGASLFAVGLSRKAPTTEAVCAHCSTEYEI